MGPPLMLKCGSRMRSKNIAGGKSVLEWAKKRVLIKVNFLGERGRAKVCKRMRSERTRLKDRGFSSDSSEQSSEIRADGLDLWMSS